jgi:nucleotide-binding universal stress UspA family protein
MSEQGGLMVLLAVDGSEHSLAAAQMLHDLSLLSDSEVRALGVLTPRNTPSQSLLLAALDGVQKVFHESNVKVRCELLHGNPAEALTEYADQHKPDLLVVGAKGLRATLGILLGGVAQQLVEYSHCPVLVVRAPYKQLQRVLLVVDGSTHSQCAVEYMTHFPFPSGTEVRVMHILPPFPKFEYIYAPGRNLYTMVDIPPASSHEIEQDIARQAQVEEQEGQLILKKTQETLRETGVEAASVLKRGDAATEILEYVRSNNIDLVVAGSRGLSAVKGWLLGSVSRKLVHYAGCSVLIVRSSPARQT